MTTVDRVIQVADRGYADSLVALAHCRVDTGDTLALFIAREIGDVFDPEDPYGTAADALERAREDLANVIYELRREARKGSA